MIYPIFIPFYSSKQYHSACSDQSIAQIFLQTKSSMTTIFMNLDLVTVFFDLVIFLIILPIIPRQIKINELKCDVNTVLKNPCFAFLCQHTINI
jgi:hypothetical protein